MERRLQGRRFLCAVAGDEYPATLALETSAGADYGLFARVLADARNADFADVALRP